VLEFLPLEHPGVRRVSPEWARHPARFIPPMAPLAQVRLTGRWLAGHRALQTAVALFALVAVAGFFLPWHEVRRSGLSGCTEFLCDCHADEEISEAEILARPAIVHTGLDHHGRLPVAVLALLAAGAVVSVLVPRFRLGVALAAASALGMIALGTVFLVDQQHRCDHQVWLVGLDTTSAALLGLSLAVLLGLVVQPVLYFGARASQARAAHWRPLPPARSLRGDRPPA
jgi:MFS family permease